MLAQLRSLSPRRLLAMGLIVAGALIGILLIILWQAGLFDSAPPPATLESAVESVRQEEQAQQAQPESQAAQPQAEAQADEPTAQAASQQQTQAQAATTQQEQGDSVSSSYASQDREADQPQAVSSDYGQQDSQGQATQQQTGQASSQDSQPQAQQQGQSSEQSSDQQAVMVPEDPELADLAGTWVLSQQGTSFVGYRIGEELANIGTTTAVGRTGDIVAALEFDGAVITSVVIEADLRTLESDQSFRDGALRTRGIETDTYPFAIFVLTEPIPIDALPVGEETAQRRCAGHARPARRDQSGQHRPPRAVCGWAGGRGRFD